MFFTKLSIFILILISLTNYAVESTVQLEDFTQWMVQFNKKYDSDIILKTKFQNFINNNLLIEGLNKMYSGMTEFKLNAFADMSPLEFKAKVLMRPQPTPKHSKDKFLPPLQLYDDIPASFDWRDHGAALTPVKDQGQVGTCWAHSAVENIEGQYGLKTGNVTKLSVEQVVDCDGVQQTDGINADCGVYGGWPYLAIQYIGYAGGIEREEDYPYCSGTGACEPCEAPGYNKTKCGPPIPYCLLKDSCQAKLDPSKFVSNLKVVDWKRVSENETDIAQQLINVGPLSIALNAEMLQFYHKGIFDPIICDPANLDHAVLLVGYGVETSKIFGTKPYWIVKNSWGEKWGESGYFRILRGKGKCGVNTQVVTAIIGSTD